MRHRRHLGCSIVVTLATILSSCAAEHDTEIGPTTRAIGSAWDHGTVEVACPEPPSQTHTDVGVTDDSILLGTTMPQTGPASLYRTIASAERAYFTYINAAQGGVHGREIAFQIEDDAYDKGITVTKTRKLVEVDKVFLMFSGLGSDTQLEVRDYLNAENVPQLFVASGLTRFSADYHLYPYTMGWQPPYQVEARIYARDVLAQHPDAKIGILHDDDDAGRDYLKGLEDGLGSHVSLIVAKESVPLSATFLDVFSRAQALKAQGADTVFIFSGPSRSIQSLVSITRLGWTPRIYLNAVSNLPLFMGTAATIGAMTQGVISVGYFKQPTDPLWENDEGMLLYRQVMSAHCPTCNVNDPLNVYGVAVAYTMVDVLERAGSNLTRCNVMSIAANRLQEKNDKANPFLLPGVRIKTTPSDPFAITQGQLIAWSGTRWVAQGDIVDGAVDASRSVGRD